jgi:hypothetical protein
MRRKTLDNFAVVCAHVLTVVDATGVILSGRDYCHFSCSGVASALACRLQNRARCMASASSEFVWRLR